MVGIGVAHPPQPQAGKTINLRSEMQEFTPEALKLLYDVFAERYRQEMAAEEDLFRTLPFFATSLGVGVAGASFALSHMPVDLLISPQGKSTLGRVAALACALLVFLAAILVCSCLFSLVAAVGARRQRVALSELRVLKEIRNNRAIQKKLLEKEQIVDDIRITFMINYCHVNESVRSTNDLRRNARSKAIVRLLVGFFITLVATFLIFIFEKLGIFV